MMAGMDPRTAGSTPAWVCVIASDTTSEGVRADAALRA